MNIAEILHKQASVRLDEPAIIDVKLGRDWMLSFAELEHAAARCAFLLHHTGIRPGDAVLVLQPMSLELYTVLLSLFRLGAVAMFPDLSAGRRHLEYCCTINPPKGLIASSKVHLLRLVSQALRRIPHKFSIGPPVLGAVSLDRADGLPSYERIEPCTEQRPALLNYTSGSTGRPKAVVRTHGFLRAQYRVLAKHLELQPGETDLTTLPIFVLANLASGVTSLIPDVDLRRPAAINPKPVFAQIQRHRPDRTVASPAFLELLLDYCVAHGQALSSFRKIFSGGAPVFPDLLKRLGKLAPRAEIIAVYGSTEAEPIAHIAWHEMTEADLEAMFAGRGLLAGPGVPEIHLEIMENQWGHSVGPLSQQEFKAICLPFDKAGEIIVSGSHVLPGYLHGHGDLETKLKVENTVWHRTGDCGFFDEDGRLWLLGRCSAVIQDGRGTLYPYSVECAVKHRWPVRRVAVGSHRGKRILVVEPIGRLGRAEIGALKNSLPWAHLDAVKTVKHIPMDKRHNAKVDYPALQKLLEKID